MALAARVEVEEEDMVACVREGGAGALTLQKRTQDTRRRGLLRRPTASAAKNTLECALCSGENGGGGRLRDEGQAEKSGRRERR